MNYKIIITKREENPTYKEFEAERKASFYGRGQYDFVPEKYNDLTQTIATLDEEQFKKVQKAIIEAMN